MSALVQCASKECEIFSQVNEASHVNEAFITLETRANSLLFQPFPHPMSWFAVCGLQSSTSAEANMFFKCKIIRVTLKCLLWPLLGESASV